MFAVFQLFETAGLIQMAVVFTANDFLQQLILSALFLAPEM